MADVTRRPKQWYQWWHKKDLCRPKYFLKSFSTDLTKSVIKSCSSSSVTTTRSPPSLIQLCLLSSKSFWDESNQYLWFRKISDAVASQTKKMKISLWFVFDVQFWRRSIFYLSKILTSKYVPHFNAYGNLFFFQNSLAMFVQFQNWYHSRIMRGFIF